MVQVRPGDERPGGHAWYGSALQEKPCVGEPRLSLVHVKTVRHEMVSGSEAAVG